MRFLLALLMLTSCFSSEKVPREIIMAKAREADPELELVMPESLDVPVVDCKSYVPRCFAGYKVKVKKIALIALEYENDEQALRAAKRINGYVHGNWAFDQVTGEPILERFVQKTFGAVKARDLGN